MIQSSVKVGIIGFGTVGSGTTRILLQNREVIKERTGIDIELRRIADRNITTDRGIKVPEGVLTTDAYSVINDPEIDIVVELIGGIRPAKDFLLDAIKNKKHVVTANKALLATDGADIFKLADEQGVHVGFEASVAGGIPIIKAMREGLVANRFNAIYGIINGTCNYILTKMTKEGAGFAETLAEAQRLGYAEADPTFDIEGIDTAHKLTILASLAYGIPLSYDALYKEGITKITAEDISFAKEFGYKIKLLAIAMVHSDEVQIRVHPTMVPDNYLLSKIDDVFNAVYVEGDAVGSTLYYGRGAGDMPTGSAVVADIVDIAKAIKSCYAIKGRGYAQFYEPSSTLKLKDINDIYSKYYFRFSALDRPGVLSKISGVLGQNNISISAVIQKGRNTDGAVPLVILTHIAKERDVKNAIKAIDDLDVVADKTMIIRVLGGE